MDTLYDLLKVALLHMQSLLNAIDPWGAIAAAVVAVAALVRIAVTDGLLAPSVRVEQVCRGRRVTLILRNFEAIALHKFINVRAEWKEGWTLERIAFRTGPWRHRERAETDSVHHDGSPGRVGAVVLRFNGLPADGAVIATFHFDHEIDAPAFSVSLGRLPDQLDHNVLRLRRLPVMTPFSRIAGVVYYWPRLLLGLSLYLVAAAYLFPDGAKPSEVDAAVAVGGFVLVILSWFVALPMQGKDTVCGYPEDGEWRPPAPAAEPSGSVTVQR